MSLFAALLLDALLGEPKLLWKYVPHPVVLMGKWIEALEDPFNDGDWRRFKGAFVVILLVTGAALIGVVLASIPYAGTVFEILLGAILIAHRSLVDHIKDVAHGLFDSLSAGREAVAKVVGRDPETLDEAGVARAAIESCAENFSDGVVAPVFWFAIAGLPGILVYKIVNTADSMIGHKNERYLEFGWAAARLDDLLNWIPARMTGALFCAVGKSRYAFHVMMRDAGQHNSPNAGWPESAMAAVLGVAIAGPRVYGGAETSDPYMHPEGDPDATPDDIIAGVELIWKSWGWVVLFAVLLAVLQSI